MNKKIITKIVVCSILIIFLGLFFYQFSLIVPPDGTSYFWYTSILDGVNPMSMWGIARGPSFPIMLWIIKHLFGTSSTGLLNGFFIFYLLHLLFSSLLLYKVIKKEKKDSCGFIWLLYIVLIMFNLVSIGYSHTLLTETIVPTIFLLNGYLIYKWSDVNWQHSKFLTCVYAASFSLLLIFMWFLKQPYAPFIFFEIFIGALLITIRDGRKAFIEKFSTLVISTLLLIVSIKSWNIFLASNGVDLQSNYNNSGFISKGIIQGLNGYYMEIDHEKVCDKDFIKSINISSEEKKKIEKLQKSHNDWCNKIKIYQIMSSKNEYISLIYDGETPDALTSFRFWSSNLVRHPGQIIYRYYSNYMGTINLHPVKLISYDQGYYVEDKLDLEYNHENKTLSAVPFHTINKGWWDYPGFSEATRNNPDVTYSRNFGGMQYIKPEIEERVEKIYNLYLLVFKISLFLAFPLAIFSFILFLKNKSNSIYYITTIMFTSSFLHILFHAFFGATIDRYAYPVLSVTILALLLLLVNFRPNKINKKEEMITIKEKKNIDKQKIIFVIPAYNESKHIKGVIEDIRKNMPKADIVVTNDCSKDNTQEIVESLGVPCLRHPFNMGYAMAVKSGIKYAFENDYDYVIQIDADGQHLASEAKKLIKTMEETGTNIVIGSRFLSKTDYQHPFFRKVGTKLFQIIIKLFCGEKITDPTSGFQLLDRSVIERYAQIGKYPEFPDANLIIEMLFEKYTISEVSVKMKLNDEGKSMHGGIIKPIKYMINVMYSIIFILLRGKKVGKQ